MPARAPHPALAHGLPSGTGRWLRRRLGCISLRACMQQRNTFFFLNASTHIAFVSNTAHSKLSDISVFRAVVTCLGHFPTICARAVLSMRVIQLIDARRRALRRLPHLRQRRRYAASSDLWRHVVTHAMVRYHRAGPTRPFSVLALLSIMSPEHAFDALYDSKGTIAFQCDINATPPRMFDPALMLCRAAMLHHIFIAHGTARPQKIAPFPHAPLDSVTLLPVGPSICPRAHVMALRTSTCAPRLRRRHAVVCPPGSPRCRIVCVRFCTDYAPRKTIQFLREV